MKESQHRKKLLRRLTIIRVMSVLLLLMCLAFLSIAIINKVNTKPTGAPEDAYSSSESAAPRDLPNTDSTFKRITAELIKRNLDYVVIKNSYNEVIVNVAPTYCSGDCIITFTQYETSVCASLPPDRCQNIFDYAIKGKIKARYVDAVSEMTDIITAVYTVVNGNAPYDTTLLRDKIDKRTTDCFRFCKRDAELSFNGYELTLVIKSSIA